MYHVSQGKLVSGIASFPGAQKIKGYPLIFQSPGNNKIGGYPLIIFSSAWE